MSTFFIMSLIVRRVHPNTVTHAFTLADPTLAWLILNGIKRIENRNFAMRSGWYAVHVSQKARVTAEREASLRNIHRYTQ